MGNCFSYTLVRLHTVIDSIYADETQSAGNAAKKFIRDCLSNPVIVRIILKHFSNFELRAKLQFVNKLWNHEARSVMRSRGNILARISCSESNYFSCGHEFRALAVVLLRMEVVPFSGIQFSISHSHSKPACECRCQVLHPLDHMTLSPLDHIILSQLPLSMISISVSNELWKYINCPTFLFAKTVLQNFNEVIEKLSLEINWGQAEFIDQVIQDRCFPRLKILKFEEFINTNGDSYIDYIMVMVSRAPNLQQLHVKEDIDLMQIVLRGSRAVLVCEFVLEAPFTDISDSLVSSVRPKAVEWKYTGSDFNFDRFNRIAPRMLEASCTTTLRAMTVDAVFAIPLMCYGIRLDKVKDFHMLIDYCRLRHVQPRILNIVKDFDFTRICPALTQVRISLGSCECELPADMSRFMEQTNVVLREPLPQRTDNITKLILDTNSALSVQFVSQMFPHVKQLEEEVSVTDRQGIPFESIWEHWVHLEKLRVLVRASDKTADFDSVFCGILPEEATELRKKDDKYLSKVMIVPVKPAITCLRGLRTLILYYKRFPSNGDDDDITFIPSKVTGLIAFARCPNLHVILENFVPQYYDALRQMKPYASVWDPDPYVIHREILEFVALV